MIRHVLNHLEKNWLPKEDRKPLVLRGARQVGKTWIARTLAKKTDLHLIEINFERMPDFKSLFESNDPKVILKNLEVYFGIKIDNRKTLLFLDEIQDAPEVFAKLRWFYEEIPDLPVIAAGSLLEFMLNNLAFSIPVGRITYCYVEPLSFEEFMEALGHASLLDYLRNVVPPFDIPVPIHQRLRDIFNLYSYVGGMPEAVLKWIKTESMNDVINVQQDLISTYRDDFFKYKGRMDVQKLDIMIKAIPFQLGEKFVYSKVDRSIQLTTAKHILDLFNKARLCHPVKWTSANYSPLEAEVKNKGFKQIFMDVGLANRFLERSFLPTKNTIDGGLSEQVVGQMLRSLFPLHQEKNLYYWTREEKGANAEIDYVIECNGTIIPIEVKSGSTGSLKSLHLFMHLKQKSLAVRINDDTPSVTPIFIKNYEETAISYTLLSIPFYLTTQLTRILNHGSFHL